MNALTIPFPQILVPCDETKRLAELRRQFVRDDQTGHFRPGRESLLLENHVYDAQTFQERVLAWLRDNVHRGIPSAWYHLMIGHDIHYTAWATLHHKHFHATERDPFEPDRIGWLENVGLSSTHKVTTAFINFESLMLVTDTTTIGDFKYHETGTGVTAEANTDVALVTSAVTGSLAARVAGTQLNPTAPTYQTVATLTATAGATWSEHGVFNAVSSVTLMDRSLVSPTVPVNSPDTVQFTYTLTKNPEP